MKHSTSLPLVDIYVAPVSHEVKKSMGGETVLYSEPIRSLDRCVRGRKNWERERDGTTLVGHALGTQQMRGKEAS